MNCPNGVTATGTIPKEGRTVACSSDLKGKTIHIETVGERLCEDRGGNINDGKIDLYMSHVDEARAWGIRKLAYTVLHD